MFTQLKELDFYKVLRKVKKGEKKNEKEQDGKNREKKTGKKKRVGKMNRMQPIAMYTQLKELDF